MTVAQAAELLSVSTATVYRLAARGELPHVRIGNNVVRIAPEDLDAYLARRRSGGEG